MNNTLDTLKAAREKIADPKRWTQRVSARDKDGWPVEAASETACSWCIIGALVAVQPSGRVRLAAAKLLTVGRAPGLDSNLSFFNDRTSPYQVMKLFDNAIKLAEN